MASKPPLIRLDDVRSACAAVCERARFVHIDSEALRRYADALPIDAVRAVENVEAPIGDLDTEERVAFIVTLNAVNFGSGWFPHLAKLDGRSGFRTIEAHLRRHFEREGAIRATDLAGFDTRAASALFGQTLAPPIDALCALFARSLADLGALVASRFGGSFTALVESANRSAERLVQTLLEMELYRDISRYEELEVPFLKRAQITAADLNALLPDSVGRFDDLDRLTMFADNLVPHVLRLDGVLRVDPGLAARIEAETALVAGSPEEVELRASAVTTVELLVDQLAGRGTRVRASELDFWLWSRGAGAHYKAHPRHRARCAYY